jgi:hypothetical protein
VQPATLDTTKITAPRQRRSFGERDLWELWLLDEAEEIPCGSIRTFLHYLCSEGTAHCEIRKSSTLATGSVNIRLSGPLADDERNHLPRYPTLSLSAPSAHPWSGLSSPGRWQRRQRLDPPDDEEVG